MWAIQCNLDKIIIFTSFLVVVIICLVLVTEKGEDYTEWLLERVGGGDTEANDLNSTQLQEAGKGLLYQVTSFHLI